MVCPGLAWARVVSYAPVTAGQAVPAIQERTQRFVALIERSPGSRFCPYCLYEDPPRGPLRLIDSRARVPARTAHPEATIAAAAYKEGSGGEQFLLILVQTGDLGWVWRASSDGGLSWRTLPVAVPARPWFTVDSSSLPDTGGPVARGAGAQIRPGTDAMPFVFIDGPASTSNRLIGVRASLEVVELLPAGNRSLRLLGGSRDGSEALVAISERAVPQVSFVGIDTRTRAQRVFGMLSGRIPSTVGDGWITPKGEAYARLTWSGAPPPPHRSTHAIAFFPAGGSDPGPGREVAAIPQAPGEAALFAVPWGDFSGAWILTRHAFQPTRLLRHDSSLDAAEEVWADPSRPVVEALHSAASGRRVLVQVHRPRSAQVPPAGSPSPYFVDPALAIWEVGGPAPSSYDELFLVENATKGFVHLDVDAVAEGGSFIFDGGERPGAVGGGGASGGSGGGGGGADVVQEWGVVKASLAQRLVIPAVARTDGANLSSWRSELIVHNPDGEPLRLTVLFAPSGGGPELVRAIELRPREIVRLEDVLGTLFSLSAASGALTLVPPLGRSVNATSRTATRATDGNGSYGTTVPALDALTATSSVPATLSAALLGQGFRTNAVLFSPDVSGDSSEARLRIASAYGYEGSGVDVALPAGSPLQINDLAQATGISPRERGALLLESLAGEVVGGVAVIDNVSNDPSWFTPDTALGPGRVIPAIVHTDGLGGARFRSDLFLTNASSALRVLTLEARAWNPAYFSLPQGFLRLVLLPGESRWLKDALATLLLGTALPLGGVAQLRVASDFDSSGVSLTSRTYALRPDGSTYGFALPPLSAFQIANAGDTLEILGAVGGPGFRTNLALVETSFFTAPTAPSAPVTVRVTILDEQGATLAAFDERVPVSRGLQIDDLFRSRGLGEGPRAALMRIAPSGGVVSAYATLVDSGTNDSSYLPAQLAARE